MVEHYLDRLARTINENWDQPALTDFYLTEDGSAQDTSCGNHYTYGEMYEEILHVCDIFQSLGLQKGDHIAICGANSAHWAIAYLAIAAYQGVVVTILRSQSPEDIAYQIDFSDAKALFTDVDLWDELKGLSLPQVEHVISLENLHILRGDKVSISNVQFPISYCQFTHGDMDELAMICFTSGSTNVMKGVMLSSRSLSANIAYSQKNIPTHVGRNEVCTLPLAHIFSLTIEFLYQISWGTHVYFIPHLSSTALFRAYAVAKPSMVLTVPFVIEKMFAARVFPMLKQPLIKCLWHTPILCKLFEKKLFQLLQQVFGGNVRWLITGGAAVNTEVEKVFRRIKFPFVVGYGMTEAGPLICYDEWFDEVLGCCGKVVDFCELTIQSNDPLTQDGEILFRGEHLMSGYYKDPESTRLKIDANGWFHTGDVGHLDSAGRLFITGRLNQDTIVLPNGENIHPEDIERKINALPEVSESIVLAREGKLVAIVVPSLIENRKSIIDLRRHVLRTINPELPLFSQLYDVEITDTPLAKTEKQTIKRYLYK
jgi:long-chain acyl-CoA synthetase